MENKTSKNNTNLQAGVAGAGGGTLLLLLANNLSDANIYKSWMIIIAPSTAVGLSVFWKWLTKSVDKYLKRRKTKELKSKLRTDIENALQNPNIPAEEKVAMQKKLAAFEQQNIDALTKAVAAIELD
ncbi:hypothetical protein [Niastella sp. OAS944]|uniref:hypothetical protein n=1 Tax=Niastella sp. OAS944 TaxID=2664089 RepID=UPI003491DC65|nr:hypothetical protein [Chitinophagaceae bacterium OAS944]